MRWTNSGANAIDLNSCPPKMAEILKRVDVGKSIRIQIQGKSFELLRGGANHFSPKPFDSWKTIPRRKEFDLTFPDRMPDRGECLCERYEIIEKIGEGGFASVFKARDKLTSREVAIKFPPDGEMSELCAKEAGFLWSMPHKNICPGYLESDDISGRNFLVVALAGDDLSKVLAKKLSAKQRVSLAKSVAMAVSETLDYVHDRKILHLDISDRNILVSDVNLLEDKEKPIQILVIDFGISVEASFRNTTRGRETLRTDNTIVGHNPHFCAPEFLNGSPGRRADQYSLARVLEKILEPLSDLEGLGISVEDIKRVLYKGLSRDPKDRYNSCGELAVALNGVLSVKNKI